MQEELIGLAEEKGFKNWFSNYSEKNHHLKGWRDYDQYIDEVELPNELNLSILQKWLREVHKFSVEVNYNGSASYYWIIREINPDKIGLDEYDSIELDDNEYNLTQYEACLEAALKFALKLLPDVETEII